MRRSRLIRSLTPKGRRRLSANPHANGGELLRDLRMPDFREYAVDVERPGTGAVESTKVLGTFLRDVMERNANAQELPGLLARREQLQPAAGRARGHPRAWQAGMVEGDDNLGVHGRVMEILSEHTLEGWLEGYLLTGRHGFFSCYEAFIHIVDSMFNQHAKWLADHQASCRGGSPSPR